MNIFNFIFYANLTKTLNFRGIKNVTLGWMCLPCVIGIMPPQKSLRYDGCRYYHFHHHCHRYYHNFHYWHRHFHCLCNHYKIILIIIVIVMFRLGSSPTLCTLSGRLGLNWSSQTPRISWSPLKTTGADADVLLMFMVWLMQIWCWFWF